MEDRAAGEIAELIGRKIIRRFLKEVEPSLWSHQGRHADWYELQALRNGSAV
jgi:hypothetical protein